MLMAVNCLLLMILSVISCGLCISNQIKGGFLYHNSLRYFETLHQNGLRHRLVKRSTLGQESVSSRILEFHSHGRNFKLVLNKDSTVLAEGFHASVIGEGGKSRDVTVDTEFYSGFDADEPVTSSASAYWDESGLVTATVNLHNETFTVEHARGQLPDSSAYTHIVYRTSDLKMSSGKRQSTCSSSSHATNAHGVRTRRATSYEVDKLRECNEKLKNHKICNVSLVADHRFCRRRNLYGKSAIRFLIDQMKEINRIFMEHTFRGCGSGFGFRIAKIVIHEQPSSEGFNSETDFKSIRDLLSDFSSRDEHSKYCLAHLFSATSFYGETALGVAHLPNMTEGYRNGICDHVTNTGLTNHVDSQGNTLLIQQALLITAHEFGHNWGAIHEDGNYVDGNYLMYPFQGLGFDRNNRKFSNSSLIYIALTLNKKAERCFQSTGSGPGQNWNCSNFLLDNREECDEGPPDNVHTCCETNCRLKPGASCSDTNHPCCDNCSFASGKKCSTSDENSCFEDAYCDGLQAQCPTPNQKKNYTRCRWGECINGQCAPVCKRHNLTPCSCTNEHDSCRWCCRNSTGDGECRPLELVNFTIPDGAPCVINRAHGVCMNNTCVETPDIDNVVMKLFEAIFKLDFVEFMKANIVGIVMILSAVVWIPLSILVSYIDRREERKNKEAEELMEKWTAVDNRGLVAEGDRRRIQASIRVHRLGS